MSDDKPLTLLGRRRAALLADLGMVFDQADFARRIVTQEAGYNSHELTSTLFILQKYATRAASLARTVEDLEDVEKYGPTGGR